LHARVFTEVTDAPWLYIWGCHVRNTGAGLVPVELSAKRRTAEFGRNNAFNSML